MPMRDQTSSQSHNVFNLSVHSSVRASVTYQACEYDILKTHGQILMPTGISGPRGKLGREIETTNSFSG